MSLWFFTFLSSEWLALAWDEWNNWINALLALQLTDWQISLKVNGTTPSVSRRDNSVCLACTELRVLEFWAVALGSSPCSRPQCCFLLTSATSSQSQFVLPCLASAGSFSPCLYVLYPEGHQALNLIYRPPWALHPLSFISLSSSYFLFNSRFLCSFLCSILYNWNSYLWFHVHFFLSAICNDNTIIPLKIIFTEIKKVSRNRFLLQTIKSEACWKNIQASKAF